MGRCYVKAYYDWIEQTAALEDDERGRLFVAILEYARSGTFPELSGREAVLFPVFRAIIDRDNQKADVNSQNGSLGGRGNKANESEQKRNEATESEQKATKDIRQKTEDIRHKTEDKRQKTEDKRQKTEDKSVIRAKRFTPPTLAEVQSYVAERHSPVDPQGFIDFYESKGWMVGKTPMKDWKAACRNAEKWERWGRTPQRGSGNVFMDMLREEEAHGTQ